MSSGGETLFLHYVADAAAPESRSRSCLGLTVTLVSSSRLGMSEFGIVNIVIVLVVDATGGMKICQVLALFILP